MSDERKPVICPWCGWEMVAREGQDIFHGKYNAYVCEGCESVSPIAYSEDSAYTAATRTPPNRPLTEEQIYESDDKDAIWAYENGVLYEPISAAKTWELLSCENYKDTMFFACKPTPADIEAARKERDT